jgi:hypothetical protein
VGVNFLDAALNQNHIVRRSERLTVPDRTHLSRTIAVRISLDRLTRTQAAAGLRYGKLSEGGSHQSGTSYSNDTDGRSPLLWVPITRVARESAAPVQIYDNEGRELARATQPELLPFVNAALYSLMKVVLRAGLDAQRTGTKLFKFLFETNRSRWLLEKAIASLVYEQHGSIAEPCTDDEIVASSEDPVRKLTLEVVDLYLQRETALLELLHHAVTEHLIVAGLLASKREHYLTYEAPPLAAVGRSTPRARVVKVGRALLPMGRQFNLRYNTHLPPSLDSVHFSLELDPRIRVRDAFLITDSDEPLRLRSSEDLLALGDLRSSADSEAYINHEIESSLSGVEELARRRWGEWLSYRDRWDRFRDLDGMRRLKWRMPNRRLLELIGPTGNARGTRQQESNPDTRRSDDQLERLATAVEQLQLGRDVTINDDPRRNGAHMYRRQGVDCPKPTQPRTAAAWLHATLTDEPTSLLGTAPSWLGALLVLVVALGLAFFRSLHFLVPWSHVTVQADPGSVQADAVVAIMLIVPSLLLRRLDLPGPMTLAGGLRVLDRTAAFLAIAATGGLAVAIATELGSDWAMRTGFLWVSLILLSLLAITGMDLTSSRIRARRPGVDRLRSPVWLAPDGERRKIRYDIVFDTQGAAHMPVQARGTGKDRSDRHG